MVSGSTRKPSRRSRRSRVQARRQDGVFAEATGAKSDRTTDGGCISPSAVFKCLRAVPGLLLAAFFLHRRHWGFGAQLPAGFSLCAAAGGAFAKPCSVRVGSRVTSARIRRVSICKRERGWQRFLFLAVARAGYWLHAIAVAAAPCRPNRRCGPCFGDTPRQLAQRDGRASHVRSYRSPTGGKPCIPF
jgi:hypothetical protein